MTSPASPGTPATARERARVARAAADACGIEIRELDDLREIDTAAALLEAIWSQEPGAGSVNVSLMCALSRTGNYVAGAFLDGAMVGVAVAFLGSPPLSMHSHIVGVDPRPAIRGIGYALKLHQRAWALARDVVAITWTFDPLRRRNAHFNIAKLGARIVEYFPNYYGELHGGGEASDRLIVRWDLLAPPDVAAANPRDDAAILRVGVDGTPVVGRRSGARAAVEVPADIDAVRMRAPAQGHAWRFAVRDALGGAMAEGARVVDFRKAEGYVLEFDGPA